MGDASGELAHGVHLLALPEGLLGHGKLLLALKALGDVVDELIGADLPAILIAQGAELHLVVAPAAARVAEGLDIGEDLAGQGPRPDRFHRRLMLGVIAKDLDHRVAGLGPDPIDALELISAGAVGLIF